MWPVIYIIVADDEVGGSYELNLAKTSYNSDNTSDNSLDYISGVSYNVSSYKNSELTEDDIKNNISTATGDTLYDKVTNALGTATTTNNITTAEEKSVIESSVDIDDVSKTDYYVISEDTAASGYYKDDSVYILAVSKEEIETRSDDGETTSAYVISDVKIIVVEESDNGITVTASDSNVGGYYEFSYDENSINFIHKDEPIPYSYELELIKQDKDDETMLENAEFAVYGASFNNYYTYGEAIANIEEQITIYENSNNSSGDAGVTCQQIVSSKEAKAIETVADVTIEDVKNGVYHIYKIEETEAPDGYISGGPWYILVRFTTKTNDDGELEVGIKSVEILNIENNNISATAFVSGSSNNTSEADDCELEIETNTVTDDNSNIAEITFTALNDKPEGYFDIEIDKIDSSGANIDTATFSVTAYEDAELKNSITLYKDKENNETIDMSEKTTANGAIIFENIQILQEYTNEENNTIYFKVEETAAPAGYEPIDYSIVFSMSFSKNGSDLNATYNEDAYALYEDGTTTKLYDEKGQAQLNSTVGVTSNGTAPTVTVKVENNEIDGSYRLYLNKKVTDDSDPVGVNFTVYRYASGTDYNDTTAGGTDNDDPLEFSWQSGQEKELIASVKIDGDNYNKTDKYIITEDSSSTNLIGLADNITIEVSKELSNGEYKIKSVNVVYNGGTTKSITNLSGTTSIEDINLADETNSGKLDIYINSDNGEIDLTLYNKPTDETYDLKLIKGEYDTISEYNIQNRKVETLDGRYFDVWQTDSSWGTSDENKLINEVETADGGIIEIASDLALDGETDYFVIQEVYPDGGKDQFGYYTMSNGEWHVIVTQEWNSSDKKYEISDIKVSWVSTTGYANAVERTIGQSAKAYLNEDSVVEIYIPNNKTDFIFDITKVDLEGNKVDGSNFTVKLNNRQDTYTKTIEEPNNSDEDINYNNYFLKGYTVTLTVEETTVPENYTSLFKDGGYMTISVKFDSDGLISSATYTVTNAVDDFDDIIDEYLDDTENVDILEVESGVDDDGNVYNYVYLNLPNKPDDNSGSLSLNKISSDGERVEGAEFDVIKYEATAGDVVSDYESVITENGIILHDGLTTESAESTIDSISNLDTNKDYYYLFTETSVPTNYMGKIKSAIIKIYYSNGTWQASIIAVKTFDTNAVFTTDVSQYSEDVYMTNNGENTWTLNWLNDIETPSMIKAKVKKVNNTGKTITDANLVLKSGGKSVSTYGTGESDYLETEIMSAEYGKKLIQYTITEESAGDGYTNILKGKTLYLIYTYVNDEINGISFELAQKFIIYNGKQYRERLIRL